MQTERIKIAMVKRGINASKLAHQLGTSKQSLSGKMKRDNWRESQLKEIGDALGCEVKVCFRMKDTGEEF